LAQAQQGDGG